MLKSQTRNFFFLKVKLEKKKIQIFDEWNSLKKIQTILYKTLATASILA